MAEAQITLNALIRALNKVPKVPLSPQRGFKFLGPKSPDHSKAISAHRMQKAVIYRNKSGAA